jgi:hypothetical protein
VSRFCENVHPFKLGTATAMITNNVIGNRIVLAFL